MALESKYAPGRKRADGQFTDREVFIRAFFEALENPGQIHPNMLVYYGVAGIGKSALRRELMRRVSGSQLYLTAAVNFEEEQIRKPETTLFLLRDIFGGKSGFSFHTFEIAYAVYWKKTRPEIPLSSESAPWIENVGLITEILEAAGGVFSFLAFPFKLKKATENVSDAVRKWWVRRGNKELEGLLTREPGDIRNMLPYFWGVDFKDGVGDVGVKPIIFLDTYEGIQNYQTDGDIHRVDEWVRELILNAPGALWVVCGKNKLRWDEDDPGWETVLAGRQHLIGELSLEDTRTLLSSRGISNTTIQEAIHKSSGGHPFFLDLCVDNYFLMSDRKGQSVGPSDFDVSTKKEIFNRFAMNIGSDLNSLLHLSCARVWDRTLFDLIYKQFRIGKFGDFDRFTRFSLVTQLTDNHWSLHDLMRRSLQERFEQDFPAEFKQVHEFLFDQYWRQIDGIAPVDITEIHENALVEAFYHGKIIKKGASLPEWFFSAAQSIGRAGRYQSLIPLFQELRAVCQASSDIGTNDCARVLIEIGKCREYIGDNIEALKSYTEARDFAVSSNSKLWLATALYHIANFHRRKKNFIEAEHTFFACVPLMEELGNCDDLARSVEKLALVLAAEGHYDRALELANKALIRCQSERNSGATALVYLALSRIHRARREYMPSLEACNTALSELEANVNSLKETFILWLKGKILHSKGSTCNALGIYVEGMALGREALDIFQGIHDLESLCDLFEFLGGCYRIIGDVENARNAYQKQLDTAILSGNLWCINAGMHNVAFGYQINREYEEALRRYEECRALKKAQGIPDDVTRGNMADIYEMIGNFNAARKLHEGLLAEGDVKGNALRSIRALGILARLCLLQGDLVGARGKVLEFESRQNMRLGLETVLNISDTFRYLTKAEILIESGNHVAGSAVIDYILRRFLHLKDEKRYEAKVIRVKLAHLFLLLEFTERGFELLDGVRDHLVTKGVMGNGFFFLNDARSLFLQGRLDDAASQADRAMEIYESSGHYQKAEARLLKTRIVIAQGQSTQASRVILHQAQELFAQYGQPHRLAESRIVEAQLENELSSDKNSALRLIETSCGELARLGWVRLHKLGEQARAEIVST